MSNIHVLFKNGSSISARGVRETNVKIVEEWASREADDTRPIIGSPSVVQTISFRPVDVLAITIDDD